VRVAGDRLLIEGEGVHRSESLEAAQASDALGQTARTFFFKDGASLVVRDGLALSKALASSTHAETFAARAPRQIPLVIASVIALVVFVVFGYAVGVPWTAQKIANALPAKALDVISATSMDLLGTMGFEPTTLPLARQEKIIAAFNALKPPDGKTKTRQIFFRSNPEHGANAVALPDGTIIVTDELVALAQNDDQILSVMCHELGHVAHRHGAQMVVQGAMVAGFLSLYLGDFSTIATGAAATLATAHYSRDAEREADEYAIAMMRANGKSPRALSAMLARMDHAYRAALKKSDAKAASASRTFTDYFSSHPGTGERIARIEAASR
jgi:Zn-dependent protease with chaperone function